MNIAEWFGTIAFIAWAGVLFIAVLTVAGSK